MVEGLPALEALQSLHGDLLAIAGQPKDERVDPRAIVEPALNQLENKFKALLDKPKRSKASRDTVLSGKIDIDGEYKITKDFQEIALQVADELDLDELEASRLVLESERDERILSRSRRECALIRFHQQRKYLLECMRLLLELFNDAAGAPEDEEQWLGSVVDKLILQAQATNFVSRCLTTLSDIEVWLRQLAERVTAAAMRGIAEQAEFKETVEYCRVSLVQQHETLAIMLCQAIFDRRAATRQDFTKFMTTLRNTKKYEYTTVHYFPALGAFISVFGGAADGSNLDQDTARALNEFMFPKSDEQVAMPSMAAAMKVWWLAEYSGWYMVDPAGSSTLQNVDIDAEDRRRSKQFLEALKEGAFEMLMSVVAEVRSPDWQDATRNSVRRWLTTHRTPTLLETTTFSDTFQKCLKGQMELFIEAFISNMPDVLRKLRIEEDEQRQMNLGPEPVLDLERFLVLIAFCYEGRPDAAAAFWEDPESNFFGFLQWASRRASTPLVTAFCEMLLSLSEDSDSATAVHRFLLDESNQAGKMRKSPSLTWDQVLKEVEHYTKKQKEKPAPLPNLAYRPSKANNDQAEHEPELTMMTAGYLRLMAKLAWQSEAARVFLLNPEIGNLPALLLQIVSTNVPSRIRACAFTALAALLSRKSKSQADTMWKDVEACMSGHWRSTSAPAPRQGGLTPTYMEELFESMGPRFEECTTFVQLLTALTAPHEGCSLLLDMLPFPENLDRLTRLRPGIEPYVDYAIGYVFTSQLGQASDAAQQRLLRCSCLDFALTCLSTFNEDLIVFATEGNIKVDAAIAVADLKTYVTLHPFSRVMEWMYDSNVIKALTSTIHQDPTDVGNAAPDSPLIISILRGIEVILKVLDLQATYQDLIRPIVAQPTNVPSRSRYAPTPNRAFGAIEDGLLTYMDIVPDLGRYCGVGCTELTLACLKLLERISSSKKIVSAWQDGPNHQTSRNKAIVVLDDGGYADAIAGTFIAEISIPLDMFQRETAPSYLVKCAMLDFLYSCILASPDRPTVAHLLLGFECLTESVRIRPGGAFDSGRSLFHNLLGIPVQLPMEDEGMMLGWLIRLRYKAMRVLRLLWTSSLTSRIVLEDLRANDFAFHLLLQGVMLQPGSPWDGLPPDEPNFLIEPASEGYVEYAAMRWNSIEYVTRELCIACQGRTPGLKRRLFEALGGKLSLEGEITSIPSIFEFTDFQTVQQSLAQPPPLTYYADVNLRVCLEDSDDGHKVCNLHKVQEMVLLTNNRKREGGAVIHPNDLVAMEAEEARLQAYMVYAGRLQQVNTYRQKILQAWTRLLMVMTESSDYTGANKVSFDIQVLQAILPNLEAHSSDSPTAAFELAKLAKVLIFHIDFASMAAADSHGSAVGSLANDKLSHLFQICLDAITKRAGDSQLRAIYYSICYRYLAALLDHDQGFLSGRQQTAKAISGFGQRLLAVICDDACGGEVDGQTSAMILLVALIKLGNMEIENFVVELLHRLNFISILVDSLRDVMDEWAETSRSGSTDQKHVHDARLALLLQLCQTRVGAQYVLQANLFRAIDCSGLFSVDPDLQVRDGDDAGRVLESHYALLAQITRILGVAIVSRGPQRVLMAKGFLEDHRQLISHVLKRAAGVGGDAGKPGRAVEERVQESAEAIMLLIAATGFLDEEGAVRDTPSVPLRFT